MTTDRRFLFCLLPAVAVYVVHASLLGSWIVDDAGISFAYARSLANGEGLVAQPGVEPVEGFTNLLWVVLLAPLIRLGWFDPVVTPKLVGGLCAVVALGVTGRLMWAGGRRPAWLVAAALTTTALFPGFTIWCASGLENGLYAMMVAWLAALCAASHPRPVVTGVVAFLVFCARPDGALYFWVFPGLVALARGRDGWRRPVTVYTGTFIGAWIALTVFRLAYFRDVLPNSFYAKRGEGVALFEWLLRELPLPLAGVAVIVLGSAVISGVAWGLGAAGASLHRRLRHETVATHICLVFLVSAVFVYHALRGDWMPEYRFATPAFVFGPAAVLALVWDVTRRWGGAGRAVTAIVSLGAVAWVGVAGIQRTKELLPAPALGLRAVRNLAVRIDAALPTGLAGEGERVTVLTPDIGGALWEDRFEVIDLMGLIDRDIAREELRNRDRLNRYLMKERPPDAVWHHGHWMHKAGLATDPEFARRYQAVWEERNEDGSLRAGLYARVDTVPRPPGRGY